MLDIIMRGIAILVGFQLLGVVLHSLGVPLPAAVLGLVLFTVSLFAGVVKLEWVEETSSLLLRNMLLFFLPIIVATIHVMSSMRGQWLAVTASVVISLIAVMLTTGYVSHRLLDKQESSK